MRIFYAVTLSPETKEALIPYRDIVANSSVKGRFVDKDNFHLTLEFIGEVNQKALSEHIEILEGMSTHRFQLEASFIASFQKRDRHVVWMGLDISPTLSEIHRELVGRLKDHGFEVEKRKYKPHITLGRQVLLLGNLEELVIAPLKIKPHSIALMESKRVGGRLRYLPIIEQLL